jgi:hypothetical protein
VALLGYMSEVTYASQCFVFSECPPKYKVVQLVYCPCYGFKLPFGVALCLV